MSAYRRGYRPGMKPGVGQCQLRLLRVLRGSIYVGPIERLAKLIGFAENSLWLAIAGAATRGLLVAQRMPSGDLRLVITRTGRQAVAHG